MKFSKYQQDFFDAVRDTSDNITLEAKAGSGKTTTIIEGAGILDPNMKSMFMAFNKIIQTELETRLPSNVPAKTFHAHGLRNLNWQYRQAHPGSAGLPIVQTKCRDIYRSIPNMNPDLESPTLRLVSLAKTTDTKYPDFNYLMTRFEILVDAEQVDEVVHNAQVVLNKSNEQDNVVDFDDMVYLPAIGHCSIYKLDALFVDERQDMNPAQVSLVRRSISNGGRIFAVGDRNQSIYAFRGAGVDAMDDFSKEIGSFELPLSICYRCDRKIIELAQSIVPEIECRDGAPDGIVDDIRDTKVSEIIRYDDLVLCRTNAPLVKFALMLIADGKKAYVRGRDIGKSLQALIERIRRKFLVSTLNDFLKSMNTFVDEEVMKFLAAEKPGPASALQDQRDTIIALVEGLNTVDALLFRIQNIFADESSGITCSSIHKAKGTEADHVFLLRPDLIPHPMAKTPWAREQEKNLKYVAITRAKHRLTFIR
jgi:DNA helicase-2/ATP-dependent DNA helicase PcrA